MKLLNLKIHLSICICIFLTSILFAQNELDSINQLISKENKEEEKFELILEKINYYGKNDTIKAFKDLKDALSFYKKKKDLKGITKTHIARANYTYNRQKYNLAFLEDSISIKYAEKTKDPSLLSKAYGLMGWIQFSLRNYKESEKYLKKGIHISEKYGLDDYRRIVDLYGIYSYLLSELGNHVKGLFYAKKSLELGQKLANKKPLIRIHSNYGIILYRNSRFTEAITEHLKAVKLAEKYGDSIWIMRERNNIGIIFTDLGEEGKALEFFKKSYAISSRLSIHRSMALSVLNMAEISENETKIDSLYHASIGHFEEAKDPNGVALAKNAYGQYLIEKENLEKAEIILKDALDLSIETGSSSLYGEILLNLGLLMLKKNNFDASEKYLVEAEANINEEDGDFEVLNNLYSYKKKVYIAKKDFKNAFEAQEKELYFERKRYDESEKVNTLKLQSEYEFEKRDKALQAEKEKQKRRHFLFLGLTGFVSILILMFILFVLQRKKQIKERHAAEMNKVQQEHRLNLANSLSIAEQEERKKIAHKLHDETGGILSIAKLSIDQLEEKLFVVGSDASMKLETAKNLVSEASESIRKISHSLMPISLEKYGLKVAVQEIIKKINVAGTIRIEEVIEGMDNSNNWNPQLNLTVYRIIQEVLNNIIKHAEATNVILQLIEFENSLTIYIEDNGKGIDEYSSKGNGVGLNLIKQNIEYLNGKVEINGEKNKGTFVMVELPIF